MVIPPYSHMLTSKQLIISLINSILFKKKVKRFWLKLLNETDRDLRYEFVSKARNAFYFFTQNFLTEGDQVLISSFSYPIYRDLLESMGVEVVIIDVESSSLGFNIEELKKADTRNTKAIIVTHIFGNNLLTDEVYQFARDRNLIIIEDAAQYFTQDFLNFRGDIAFYSFSATKTPTTFDGGLVVCRHKQLMNYISTPKYKNSELRYIFKTLFYCFITNRFIFKILNFTLFSIIEFFDRDFFSKLLSEEGSDIEIPEKSKYKRMSNFQLALLKEQYGDLPKYQEVRKDRYQYLSQQQWCEHIYLNDQSSYQVLAIRDNSKIIEKSLKELGVPIIDENFFNLTKFRKPYITRFPCYNKLPQKKFEEIVDGVTTCLKSKN